MAGLGGITIREFLVSGILIGCLMDNPVLG